MDTTGLAVVRQEMRVVGVPIGTEQFQRDFLQEAVNGEPVELVRALVPTDPPANPRRRPWAYQQQLHQRRCLSAP